MTREFLRAPAGRAHTASTPDVGGRVRTPRRRPLARLRQRLIVIAAVKPVLPLDRRPAEYEAENLCRAGLNSLR